MSVNMCNCEPLSQMTRERRRCCWKMVFNTSSSPARSPPLTFTLQSLTPLFVHLHHSACKVSAPTSLLISSDKSHDLNSSSQIWWLQNWFGSIKKKKKKVNSIDEALYFREKRFFSWEKKWQNQSWQRLWQPRELWLMSIRRGGGSQGTTLLQSDREEDEVDGWIQKKEDFNTVCCLFLFTTQSQYWFLMDETKLKVANVEVMATTPVPFKIQCIVMEIKWLPHNLRKPRSL